MTAALASTTFDCAFAARPAPPLVGAESLQHLFARARARALHRVSRGAPPRPRANPRVFSSFPSASVVRVER